MSTTPNIAALVSAGLTDASPNMTEATKGGDYTPPAAGMAQARLVAYIETGLHETSVKGTPKEQYEVQLTFELSGPNHQPRKLDDGTLIPQRLTAYLSAPKGGYNAPLNEKSHLYKLFKRMNYQGDATHMAQLLGRAFLVEVFHYKKNDGTVGAGLRGDNGYNIGAPQYADPISGQIVQVPVAEALTPLRVFMWNTPDVAALKDMWDTLFIDGEYEAEEGKPARSKNVIQDTIKKAINFTGSPIYSMLAAAGLPLGGSEPVPQAAPPAVPAAAAPIPPMPQAVPAPVAAPVPQAAPPAPVSAPGNGTPVQQPVPTTVVPQVPAAAPVSTTSPSDPLAGVQ